jgi:hypothetical protein
MFYGLTNRMLQRNQPIVGQIAGVFSGDPRRASEGGLDRHNFEESQFLDTPLFIFFALLFSSSLPPSYNIVLLFLPMLLRPFVLMWRLFLFFLSSDGPNFIYLR